jgi:hypothetical protein
MINWFYKLFPWFDKREKFPLDESIDLRYWTHIGYSTFYYHTEKGEDDITAKFAVHFFEGKDDPSKRRLSKILLTQGYLSKYASQPEVHRYYSELFLPWLAGCVETERAVRYYSLNYNAPEETDKKPTISSISDNVVTVDFGEKK